MGLMDGWVWWMFWKGGCKKTVERLNHREVGRASYGSQISYLDHGECKHFEHSKSHDWTCISKKKKKNNFLIAVWSGFRVLEEENKANRDEKSESYCKSLGEKWQ